MLNIKDWNEHFTSFVIDSINAVPCELYKGEKGILNHYHFKWDSYYTRCLLTKKRLVFQTVLDIDFDDNNEDEVNCIDRIEGYLREALNFDKELVGLKRRSYGKSNQYDGYKLVYEFEINEKIKDVLITLAKIKGYKL